MVVMPETPVTVNVAVPFGVPVYVGPGLPLVLPLLQPANTEIKAKTTRHMPNARRWREAWRNRFFPATSSAARAAEIPRDPHGLGLRFEGLTGSAEFDVEKVSWITVPLGGGKPVAGLWL